MTKRKRPSGEDANVSNEPEVKSRREITPQSRPDSESSVDALTQSKSPASEVSDEHDTKKLQVTEKIGDLFSAPDNTVLIHACNCQGSWGAGIAVAFKQRYPEAYQTYHKHCISPKQSEFTGTTLLISPMEKPSTGSKAHFIGCLFTSQKKGSGKDAATKILDNTAAAMEDLLEQAHYWNEEDEPKIEGLQMCKINSGKFGVKWERTKAVLENVRIASIDKKLSSVTVISRKEDP